MQHIFDLNLKISKLLDSRNYDLAQEILQKEMHDHQHGDYLHLKAIAGFFIDLGDESFNLQFVEKGLNLLLDHKENIQQYVSEDSINYCIGNAYQSIFRINTANITDFFPIPEKIETLFEAKQYYFKSFKQLDLKNLNHYSIQVLTNLGNNLINSGRYVEALQLYDTVLDYNPDFFYAQAAKADGLITMATFSQCSITTGFFVEVYRLFNNAEKHPIPLEEVRHRVQNGKAYALHYLKELNFCISKIPQEIFLNNEEYKNHSVKLKYFLDNFLSLSEHSLYCKCNGSEIDDITIGYKNFKTKDKKIVQSELLCNRLKSEFCLSKELLFEYFDEVPLKKETTHYEILVDGILNGIKYEKLRTSFRLCFGILDKIAEGICYIFNLNISKNESIYFENFWNSKRNNKRWEEINQKKNIHLTALYSIACDLEKINGEFGFYKEWRNKLEHGVFSLNDELYLETNWEEPQFSLKTDVKTFEKETLRLLQLTRAAIFSFVFCARTELIKST
jgi:hypothetical protein